MSEVHVPPQGPPHTDHESMELDDDSPPYTPRPSTSTESESSDSDQWPTISNAQSAEPPQSEKTKAAESGLKDKTKFSRRISDTATASGVDMVNAAQLELRSVDPAVSFCLIPSPLTGQSAE